MVNHLRCRERVIDLKQSNKNTPKMISYEKVKITTDDPFGSTYILPRERYYN